MTEQTPSGLAARLASVRAALAPPPTRTGARPSGHDRPLVALTSALLVAALLLAPTSAWFAQASGLGPLANAWHLLGNAGTNPGTDFLGTSDNQALVLRTNKVEALRVLAGSGTNGGNVGIGTTAPDARLSVAGTIHALSGGFQFPDGTTQATAGVTAVSASGPLASSGGTTPTVTLTGVVPVANGGTGLTSPGTAGSYLRSDGTSWTSGAIQAGDLPSLASSYIQNGTSPQTGASFNVGGNGTVGGSLAVTGSSTLTGKVGIGAAPSTAELNVAGDVNTTTGYDLGGTMVLQTPGVMNLFVGVNAGAANSTASNNTATGQSALASITTGNNNTAAGAGALRGNTTGFDNTAAGQWALLQNTTGSTNTATGAFTLVDNTTGSANTAAGYAALGSNTTGFNNTATGQQALQLNTTGASNTATGQQALGANTTGSNNTATGLAALAANATGIDNTATGAAALQQNATGNFNTAAGRRALNANSTADNNTAVGWGALQQDTTGDNNTAVGVLAGSNGTTGSLNTCIGYACSFASPTVAVSNATAIGAHARVSASNALVLGGTGANAVKVGIGTETPHSTLEVAASPDGGFGNYLQLPIVHGTSAPPLGDCNGTTHAGRMVLQENNGSVTLWICAPSGGAPGSASPGASAGRWVAK